MDIWTKDIQGQANGKVKVYERIKGREWCHLGSRKSDNKCFFDFYTQWKRNLLESFIPRNDLTDF